MTASNKIYHPRQLRTREWLEGIPYEVAFWRSYYGNPRRRADLFRWSNYGKECVLDNFNINAFISEFRRKYTEEPLILDVGCALSYVLGTKLDGRNLRIVYVDPLASFYNRILDEYSIDRPRITYGMAEALPASFSKESVAFVHVRNALDHSADPMRAILAALVVLKRGGILYLNHHPNEAQHENYRGFHQYNISIDQDSLVIWNPQERINVSEYLKDFADVSVGETDGGNVVAIIHKKSDVPLELYNETSVAHHISDMLEETVGYFHSLPASLRYQFKRIHSTAGHKLMRLLPYSVVNRIKRFLAKK